MGNTPELSAMLELARMKKEEPEYYQQTMTEIEGVLLDYMQMTANIIPKMEKMMREQMEKAESEMKEPVPPTDTTQVVEGEQQYY